MYNKKLFFDIILTYHPFDRQLNDFLLKHNLRRPEWAILYLLVSAPHLALIDVGRYLNMDRGNVTRAIKHLISLNIIEMHPSETDRRKKNVIITENGHQIFNELLEKVNSFELELLEGISEEEQRITQETLEKVKNKLISRERENQQ
ncbi:MarR family winged helix-turn-helix transcriptional regulator [Rummeliibacillus sp. JY-2-4R]